MAEDSRINYSQELQSISRIRQGKNAEVDPL